MTEKANPFFLNFKLKTPLPPKPLFAQYKHKQGGQWSEKENNNKAGAGARL